jgi:hypothetical protein|tara:strand:+ start:335 stop:517 length:183 start_codon:yes stop_codon:yes gene_type:complete
MKNWLILTMMKSKKFWYAVSSIVVPMLVQYLGVDEATASNLFYACLTLVVGQGIADSARR